MNNNIKAVSAVTMLASTLCANSAIADDYRIRANKSVSPIYERTPDGFEVVHKAKGKITRFEDKICVNVKTRDLNPGAYTAWWIIFNQPEYCENPVSSVDALCSPPDLSNPSVRATVMWSAAGIVGANGKTYLSACLNEGEITRELQPPGTQEGLVNPLGAEIHINIKDHGPAIYDDAETLGSQLNSLNGGCADTNNDIEGYPCIFPQFTVFAPSL